MVTSAHEMSCLFRFILVAADRGATITFEPTKNGSVDAVARCQFGQSARSVRRNLCGGSSEEEWISCLMTMLELLFNRSLFHG